MGRALQKVLIDCGGYETRYLEAGTAQPACRHTQNDPPERTDRAANGPAHRRRRARWPCARAGLREPQGAGLNPSEHLAGSKLAMYQVADEHPHVGQRGCAAKCTVLRATRHPGQPKRGTASPHGSVSGRRDTLANLRALCSGRLGPLTPGTSAWCRTCAPGRGPDRG